MVYQKNRTWRVKFIQKAFLNTMKFYERNSILARLNSTLKNYKHEQRKRSKTQSLKINA